MPVYIAEVRDSDGNDCTVFDALIVADSREAASEQLWRHLETAYPNDESDGGFGTYHPCDCACGHRKRTVCPRCRDSWECSHGGLLVSEPSEIEEYPDEATARQYLARYHSLIDLTR